MPTIRIDDEVYEALAGLAKGFMTPNDVLRDVLRDRLGPHGSGSESAAPRSRVGRWEYQIPEGQWLESRDYLAVIDATGDKIVQQHQRAFDTALRGNGNGMSNLAKDVSKKLGHPGRPSN